MKKGVAILVIAVLVLLSAGMLSGDAAARVFVRGGVWIGPGWGPWWGPSYYPYYPYNPYYEAPPAVIQQRPTYIEPTPQPEEQSYWYFCTKPQGYYPYVKKCPSGWLKVVPPSAPPDQGMDNAPYPDLPDQGR